MKKVTKALMGFAGFLLAAGILSYIIFTHPHPNPQPQHNTDALCTYVDDSLHLKCVVVLGSEGLLGPGAVVDYPANATLQTRVPLPNADLFSSSCLVPGEQANSLLESLRQQKDKNAVTLPEMTYSLNRSFQLGVQLPVPQLANLILKAGPNANDVTDITLKVPQAWVKFIDEFRFAEILANSGVRKECVDRLLASQYRVVSKAVVGQDLSYEFSDKHQQSYSFGAALGKGQLILNGGTGSDIDENQATKILAASPVVLGVDFLDPAILKQQPKLTLPVVYSPSGQTTVSLSGSGGEGHLQPTKQSAPIGNTAAVRQQGGESSECDGGFERTKSSADVSAIVKPRDDQTLDFSVIGSIAGGHYATGSCILGKLANISGHDTGVDLQVFFSAGVRTTVRSADMTSLKVEYSGMPDDLHILVHDPLARVLPAREPGSQAAVGRDGTLAFSLNGVGVYFVEVSSSVGKTVSGAGRETASTAGVVKVTVN